jgi:hypothetical protein
MIDIAKPPVLAEKLARARSGNLSPRKSKSKTLKTHLRRQKMEVESRKLNKHGDEISLGTLEAKKRNKKKKLAIRRVMISEGGDEGGVPTKHERPWRGGRMLKLGSIAETNGDNRRDKGNKDFFEDNKHVFDRSVFNFNQSFSRRLDEADSEAEDEADTVVESVVEREAETFDEQAYMMDSADSFGFDAFDFGMLNNESIGTKVTDRRKHKAEEFDETWAKTEADKTVAAQMSQKREYHRRAKANGKVEKKEEGIENVPRLFLFEGEKLELEQTKKKKRKQKKKDRKKQKKLENKLSKEFRKAMKEIFESESEEEYDKTFGEREDDMSIPKSSRRTSMASSFASHMSSSNSILSEAEEEVQFDDDYLKKLKARSMQNDVKDLLYDEPHKSPGGKSLGARSFFDDAQQSFATEGDGDRLQPARFDWAAEVVPARPRRSRKKARVRRNRSGELVGPDIDPADVYAREVEKKKEKKTFSISDLRKEMEELKQGGFGNGFDGQGGSKKAFKLAKKSPNPAKQKSSAFLKGNKSGHNKPPSLANLGGAASRKSFDIGGTLGAPPTIIDDNEEEAFLTGGNGKGPSYDTGGFNDNSQSRTGRSTGGLLEPSKPDSQNFNGGFSISNFGMGLRGGLATLTEGFGGGGENAPSGGGLDAGGFGGTGFQEPLPLPEMREEEETQSPRKKASFMMAKVAGKMKKSFAFGKIGRRKNQLQDHGMVGDGGDDSEGGMGLLG